MYKQNNRFSRRSEGSIARNTMGNRIGKPLAGGKFHASRKSDVRKDEELDEKKAKAEKPVVRKILSFDDIKNQVAAWMENGHGSPLTQPLKIPTGESSRNTTAPRKTWSLTLRPVR